VKVGEKEEFVMGKKMSERHRQREREREKIHKKLLTASTVNFHI
jgi:hypothetical protein